MWSGALDSFHILLPHPLISLAQHITTILISSPFSYVSPYPPSINSQSILSTALYIGYPISQGLYLILFQGTYNYHLPSAMLVCSFLMLLGALFQYSLLIRKDAVFTVL